MTEQVEVQEEQSQEVSEQLAFEAGFNNEPVETPAPVAEPAPAEEAAPEAAEPAAEETPAEPERNQWGYTDEEMKTLLSKAAKVDEIERNLENERQKIYGKLGEYNRTIQQMQTANKGGDLTPRQLNHLRGEFPELAALLEKDFGEAQAAPAQTAATQAQPAFDPAIIDERLSQTSDALSKQYEKRLLTMQHPTWADDVKTDEFKTWVALQPVEYQHQLDSSWDALFIADGLNKFKTWRETAQSAANKKTARLERAVVPTGVTPAAPPAMDENELLMAGWKSVRG